LHVPFILDFYIPSRLLAWGFSFLYWQSRVVNDVDDLVALLVEVHGEFNTGLVDDFELQVRSAVVQVGVERDLAPAGRVV